jgi:predicted O-linked N-acetylglucosamine transferase (SPINDLY family)
MLDPGHVAAIRLGIDARLRSSDWRRRDDDKRQIAEAAAAGFLMIRPFYFRAICESEADSLTIGRLSTKGYPSSAAASWRGDRYRHDKIRIAYKMELHDPTTFLIAAVFEHHDKARFETTAVSLDPDDGGKVRRRMEAAFDRVVDVQTMTDAEVAKLLRELEIDIFVDLGGNVGQGRTGILAHRAAPVQVNYLGYPSTMGAPFIDYMIADSILIPDDHQIHYSEKVVYLPHTYLPNDYKGRITEKTSSRGEAELPETGFVFACANTFKFTPEMCDVWMRLLRKIDGSVLWVRFANTASMTNLRREAEARFVAPERLIFAPYVRRVEDYLARLRQADVFLDTQPFNACTTACDALWAGLPVLTLTGATSFGRMAASMLHAAGLPELVTSSLAEYEELALALARESERLGAIKAKLMRNRDTAPLFDTARITRDLEAAYTMMWERTQRGEPPESFSVAGAVQSAEAAA